MRIKAGIVFIFISLGFINLAYGDCTPQDFAKSLGVDGYTGKIADKLSIEMALVVKPDGKVVGLYAYPVSVENIKLDGKLKDNQITLTEYDAAHQPAAIFTGTFSKNNVCSDFSGTWRNLKSGKTLPFALRQDWSSGGTIDNIYAVAGVMHDAKIDKAAMRFRNAVISNNKAVVASCFNYPIKIFFAKTRKELPIKNAADLIAHYDQIFTPEEIQDIKETIPHLMFSNSQGVMLDGSRWFDSNGKFVSYVKY